MTDSQQPLSGVDMARAALLAARAAAKTRPTQPQKKTRTTRTSVRRAGDPMGLGTAITRMMTDRGWQPPEPGGSIIDQWASIAPELAGKVHAVRYEHETRILHLRPASDAYATQLRLYQAQVLAKVQQTESGASVRSLKILPTGAAPEPAPHGQPAAATTPQPAIEAPVNTRENAHPGYRHVLALAMDNRYQQPAGNSYEEEARQRQIAAARANRLPDSEDRHAYWAQQDATTAAGPAPGSMAASEAAAIAYKRSQAAGRDIPRRAFDVA